jgi:hypothetical protein
LRYFEAIAPLDRHLDISVLNHDERRQYIDMVCQQR